MKKLMLIIEDNNFMKVLLGNLFSLNYNIHTVSNGYEALDWLYNGNMPNVIISDIVMPEMDGFEFLENIRGSTFFNNIPLVMLSGVDKSDDRIKCLQLGANDYIIKPFNPEELTIRIHNLLKSA
ncbi:response regulator [Aureispira]|nr:response regulator [Aureispira sp.]